MPKLIMFLAMYALGITMLAIGVAIGDEGDVIIPAESSN